MAQAPRPKQTARRSGGRGYKGGSSGRGRGGSSQGAGSTSQSHELSINLPEANVVRSAYIIGEALPPNTLRLGHSLPVPVTLPADGAPTRPGGYGGSDSLQPAHIAIGREARPVPFSHLYEDRGPRQHQALTARPDALPDYLKPLHERCRSFLEADDYLSQSPYRQMLTQPSPQDRLPHVAGPPLYTSIIDSWVEARSSDDERHEILDLLDKLTSMVNRRFAGGKSTNANRNRYVVDVFGSVSWGGETGVSGDLDLVIIDRLNPKGYDPKLWRVPQGQRPPKSRRRPTPIAALPAVYKLYPLANGLTDIGMTVKETVVWASTPIVKFEDPETCKDCDVCVNDMGGWYNSSLILHYCQISPYVLRPLIHTLKLWASTYKLNNPSGNMGPATMSSYCLTLMAIAYLQGVGELPNLQATVRPRLPDEPDIGGPNVIWMGYGKQQGMKGHIAFDKTPPKSWSPSNPYLRVDQAVRGFFSYFNNDFQSPGSERQFSYRDQIVSVLQGGIVDRPYPLGHWARVEQQDRQKYTAQGLRPQEIQSSISNTKDQREQHCVRMMGKGDRGIHPQQWDEKQLVVQDPFLWQKNCAGGISADGLQLFCTAVAETDKLLKSTADVDVFDLLEIDSITQSPAFQRASAQTARLEARKTAREGAKSNSGSAAAAPRPTPQPAPAASSNGNGDRRKQFARRGGGNAGGKGGKGGRGGGSRESSQTSSRASSRGKGGGGEAKAATAFALGAYLRE